ncbi:MAG: DUF3467 domain-containing protein [Planctomycetaceae bacterium]
MSTADTPQSESAPDTEARQAPMITVDDSDINAAYSNFCRVSSTPEEMILDLGLNPNPYGAANTKIKVNQRIIMNHYTAKRLLGALSAAVQRHEGAFGVLETDVRKRVKEPVQK